MKTTYQKVAEIITSRVEAIPSEFIIDTLGFIEELVLSDDLDEKHELAETIMEMLFPELIGKVIKGNI